MKPLKIPNKKGPEAKIQEAIIKYLRYREWFVKHTHGSLYQAGFPDLYACHIRYGARWIEVKNPLAYKFTTAQLESFPQFSAHGAKIWIMTAATDAEYSKLFGPENWYTYLQIWRGR